MYYTRTGLRWDIYLLYTRAWVGVGYIIISVQDAGGIECCTRTGPGRDVVYPYRAQVGCMIIIPVQVVGGIYYTRTGPRLDNIMYPYRAQVGYIPVKLEGRPRWDNILNPYRARLG